MKLFLFLSMLCSMCFYSAHSFGQNMENAGEYMHYISEQQDNISKRFMSYSSASAHGKRAKKVENLRSKLMDEIQESKMNISSLPAYKGDKSYRDSAASFMKFYYNVMNDDYSKIINMEEIAEKSYDDMEIYLNAEEKVQEKLSEANERIQLAQKNFAAKNNITLTADKTELGQMMEEVGGLSKHYHEVYLIFFKPSIQETHLLEAVGKGNVTGIEQSKNAMNKYAQEGLDKLKTMKGYKGDMSIVSACTSALKFFLKEADKSSAASDFYLNKERFESIKKDMEKKGSPSKDELAAYNKAVNDFNKSVASYNDVNNEMNSGRNDMTKDWNNAVKSYFDEHTPRYK